MTTLSTTTAVTIVTIAAETPVTSTVVVTVTDIQTVVAPAQGGATQTITVTSTIRPQKRAVEQVDALATTFSATLPGAASLPTGVASSEGAMPALKKRQNDRNIVKSVLTKLSTSVVTETPTAVVTSTAHVLSTVTVPAPIGSTSTVFATIFVGPDGLPTTPTQPGPTTPITPPQPIIETTPPQLATASTPVPQPTTPTALPITAPSTTPAAAAAAAAAALPTTAPLLTPSVATGITVGVFVGTLLLVLTLVFCLWGKGKKRGPGGTGTSSHDEEKKPTAKLVPAAARGDSERARAAALASARFSTSSGTLNSAERGEVAQPLGEARRAGGSGSRPASEAQGGGGADDESPGPTPYRETVRIMFKLEDIERWEDLERLEEPPKKKTAERSPPRAPARRPGMYRHPSALPRPLALGQGDAPAERGPRDDDFDNDEETIVGSEIMQTSSIRAKQSLPAIPPPARIEAWKYQDSEYGGKMPGFI